MSGQIGVPYFQPDTQVLVFGNWLTRSAVTKLLNETNWYHEVASLKFVWRVTLTEDVTGVEASLGLMFKSKIVFCNTTAQVRSNYVSCINDHLYFCTYDCLSHKQLHIYRELLTKIKDGQLR